MQAPHGPSKVLSAFLTSHFGLDDTARVATSVVSRHSACGTSSVNDIVLYEEPAAAGLCAGHVWAHVEVNDRTLTLLQQLRLLEEDTAEGTALWRTLDEYTFIDTKQIVDAVIWSEHDAGVIRTIVPRDMPLGPG